MAPAQATKGVHRNNRAYLWQTPLMYGNNKCTFFRSRQSAVGVQTRLWAGRQDFRNPAAARHFSPLQNPQTGPEAHPARIQWAPWFPSAAKAVGAWGCPLTLIYCSTDCRCQESCFCRPGVRNFTNGRFLVAIIFRLCGPTVMNVVAECCLCP
jgi:hypothetical protein